MKLMEDYNHFDTRQESPVSGFIVTKILQYVNATNIEVSGAKVLLLVDNFMDAENFYRRLIQSQHDWTNIHFFSNEKQAFAWIRKNRDRVSDIYTYSDYGLNFESLLWHLPSVVVHVYEEGIGTYFNSLLKEHRMIKNTLIRIYALLSGNEIKFGGNKRTSEIIIYKKDFHAQQVKFRKTKQRSTFKKPFVNHFSEIMHLFEPLDEELKGITSQNILVYIPSWNIQSIDQQKDSYDLKIIKPHPHLKNLGDHVDGYDYSIPASVPAELLLLQLVGNNNQITVVSHYSTATLYFRNFPKICFIDIQDHVRRYELDKIFLELAQEVIQENFYF